MRQVAICSLHLRRLAVAFLICASTSACSPCFGNEIPDSNLDNSLRVNQFQLIGTHNSYHVAPDPVAMRTIRVFAPREAESIDCSLSTIPEQLSRLHLRHFELDLYLDPEGGLYANPLALKIAAQQNDNVPPHDPKKLLKRPGIKVLHSPDFDFRTTTYTLVEGLQQIKEWSDRHRDHFPIFILLELKSESFSPVVRPPKWNSEAVEELERTIVELIPRERILRPDDIRAGKSTLRESVEGTGWPKLGDVRGRLVFLLDNEDDVRQTYLAKSQTLDNRLLFVSVARSHPAAAWMKRNEPIGSFDDISSLVSDGFLVRTRADAGLVEARTNDTARREKALASGAQLISTDFPAPDPRWPNYVVSFERSIRPFRSQPSK